MEEMKAMQTTPIPQNSTFLKVTNFLNKLVTVILEFLWLLEKKEWSWSKLSGNFSTNVLSQGFTAPQGTSQRTFRTMNAFERC